MAVSLGDSCQEAGAGADIAQGSSRWSEAEGIGVYRKKGRSIEKLIAKGLIKEGMKYPFFVLSL